MRRTLSAVAGALLLGVGAFALVVAGVLAVVVGSDGVASAPQARAVTPATAIVVPVTAIDAGLPDAVPTGRATIEAVSLDERPLFVGAGPADDVLAYLNGTPYEVAEGADARSATVDLEPVGGDGTASPPTAQSLWTVQTAGTGTQRIEVTTAGPDQLAVIMRVDGASPVDVRMATTVEVEGAFPATIALAAAGAAAATLGAWLLLGPASRPRRGSRGDGDRDAQDRNGAGPTPAASARPSATGLWGMPVAPSDTAASPGAPPSAASEGPSLAELPVPRAPVDLRAPVRAAASGPDAPDGPPREA